MTLSAEHKLDSLDLLYGAVLEQMKQRYLSEGMSASDVLVFALFAIGTFADEADLDRSVVLEMMQEVLYPSEEEFE